MQAIITDLIGIPFIDGGRTTKGLDCWGLVLEVYKRYGIELKDYKICCEAASRIGNEIDLNRPYWKRVDGEPPVPALVVIRFGSEFCNHTGVYIGNQQFIHARNQTGVAIDRIDSINWRNRIEGFYVPRGDET